MREKGLDQLVIYEGFRNEALVRRTCALFQQLVYRNTPFSPIAGEQVGAADYYEVQRSLLAVADSGEHIPAHGGAAATVWQQYIAGIIGSADNIFSRMAEKGVYDENIYALAAEELKVVRFLYRFDFAALARAAESQTGIRSGAENIGGMRLGGAARRQDIHAALSAETEQDSAKALAAYYRSYGSGIFEASSAFSWDGSFTPVRHDPSVTMDSIIGYERQKARLIENTELLTQGLPASNVLLYGDSGTGKSSSVKALLNMFSGRGLKLISLPKSRLGEITKVIDRITGRGLTYLIFIDDLSFDEGENEYKAFKSAIEGRITSAKTNWIVCVTSNRRNIVREVWKDRETQDDVHLRDNLQEKKSLADRFGLTIIYEAPDKREYLEIVRGLAAKAGLALSGDELDAAALTWEIRHGGRSGRTARGFVDHRYALEQKGQ
jgi:predicted AAA+ superfamily ATPase